MPRVQKTDGVQESKGKGKGKGGGRERGEEGVMGERKTGREESQEKTGEGRLDLRQRERAEGTRAGEGGEKRALEAGESKSLWRSCLQPF